MERAIERVPQAVRRRRARSPATSRPPRARGSCSIAASTAIKVGIGPGGGCTTRLTTNFGVPQVQALVECRLAVGRSTCRSSPTAASSATARIAQALLFGGDSRDARQRVRRHRGDARRDRAQVGAAARVAEGRARCRSRCCAAWRRSRRSAIGSTSRTPTRSSSRRSAPKGMEVSVPARGSARHDHPRHAEASLLVDQLRRRREPGRAASDVLGGPAEVHDSAVAVLAARVVRDGEPARPHDGRRRSRASCERMRTRPASPFCRASSRPGPANTARATSFIGVQGSGAARRCAARVGARRSPRSRTLLHSPIHEERALALLLLVDAFEHGDEASRRIYGLYLATPGTSTTGISWTVRRAQIVGGWLRDRSTAPLTRSWRGRSRCGSGGSR